MVEKYVLRGKYTIVGLGHSESESQQMFATTFACKELVRDLQRAGRPGHDLIRIMWLIADLSMLVKHMIVDCTRSLISIYSTYCHEVRLPNSATPQQINEAEASVTGFHVVF